MSIETKLKLKSNINYLKFLRENSYWYKYLNRSNQFFKDFENEMKITYKLRPTDRISKAIDTFDMIQTILTTLKQ